ncbi:general secretion pathway protein K [Candidatus Magnetoovum chiemensis]|nr:general secretion pathway protein K [Candidatus Magnetoovum chiemensis]
MKEKGIALILVLWVIAILIGAATVFSYQSRIEAQANFNLRELTAAKYLAQAGINRAIIEILYNQKNFNDDQTWKLDGKFKTVDMENGSYKVKIATEMSKIDINYADDTILKGLLNSLGLDIITQEQLVDCIQDWKDEDDLHRLKGAERDYYMSLKEPYEPADASFTSVDELLLVKGMTQEIFYGTEGKKGLKDFVTVFSYTPLIDIITAPKEIIMALPDFTEDIANNLIDYRNNNDIKHINQLKPFIPNFRAVARYIGVMRSTIYSIDAVGMTENSKNGYGIKAIVMSSSDIRFLYYKLHEVFKEEEFIDETATEHNNGEDENNNR